MELSAWPRERGISYKTAYRLNRKGRFPAPTEQLPQEGCKDDIVQYMIDVLTSFSS